ncbi:TPA: hypothetical protein SMN53_003452 [Proteus mirabilis]|nr:hypothetical protein [Proteus mirabilis]
MSRPDARPCGRDNGRSPLYYFPERSIIKNNDKITLGGAFIFIDCRDNQ